MPTKRMRELGFKSRPCGVDGPGAWKIATEENARWLRFHRGEEPAPALDERTRDAAEIAILYVRGSIGEAFQRYLRTLEWSSKAESTRNKVWWPAWLKRIKPVFAEVRPDEVTMEDLSEWRAACEERYGRDAAHKAVKVWRSFWKVMEAMGYANKADPSLAIRNRAPRPRSDRYREGEVVRLAKAAWSNGYRGLACIIAVCWDTQFSPGDVRKLAPRHAALSDKGLIFDLTVDGRSKTRTAAIGTLSPRSIRLIGGYLDQLGVELHQDAALFRQRNGRPYPDDKLAKDFAHVRELVFGTADRRQLRDMRRSGAIEAVAGRVDKGALATKMANGIDHAGFLWRTYVPVDLAAVRAADEARMRGRKTIRENEKRTGVVTPEVWRVVTPKKNGR